MNGRSARNKQREIERALAEQAARAPGGATALEEAATRDSAALTPSKRLTALCPDAPVLSHVNGS